MPLRGSAANITVTEATMRQIIGWGIATMTGFLGGYMGAKNGFPAPWQQFAGLAFIAGLFLSMGLISPDYKRRRGIR